MIFFFVPVFFAATLASAEATESKIDLKGYNVQLCSGLHVPFVTSHGSTLFACPNPSPRVPIADANSTAENLREIRAEIRDLRRRVRELESQKPAAHRAQ